MHIAERGRWLPDERLKSIVPETEGFLIRLYRGADWSESASAYASTVITAAFCVSLTWRAPQQNQRAIEAMRVSAAQVAEVGCIDAIVPEPQGGAHADAKAVIELLGAALRQHLSELKSQPNPGPSDKPSGEVPQNRAVLRGKLNPRCSNPDICFPILDISDSCSPRQGAQLQAVPVLKAWPATCYPI